MYFFQFNIQYYLNKILQNRSFISDKVEVRQFNYWYKH
jgi:hypothetical protein